MSTIKKIAISIVGVGLPSLAFMKAVAGQIVKINFPADTEEQLAMKHTTRAGKQLSRVKVEVNGIKTFVSGYDIAAMKRPDGKIMLGTGMEVKLTPKLIVLNNKSVAVNELELVDEGVTLFEVEPS